MPGFMFFSRLFRRSSPEREAAIKLYETIVTQTRQPVFFLDYQVPDTVDGRFDLLCIHAWLVMERLAGRGEAAASLSQELYDYMFADMDSSLREIGIGDMSIGKRVKDMINALNGRTHAYREALQTAPANFPASGDPLCPALRRNLYGTLDEDPAPAVLTGIASYIRAAKEHLDGQSDADLLGGKLVTCPPPPALAPDALAPEEGEQAGA